MIHFNAESWKNHQLCVLQVLNAKEENPARKEEKFFAKAEMSQHNLRMLQHNPKMSQHKLKETSKVGRLCRDRHKARLKVEV